MCGASNLHTVKTVQAYRTANIASDQKDHPKDDTRAGSLLCRRIKRAGETGHSPNRRGRKRRNFLMIYYAECTHFRGKFFYYYLGFNRSK